LVPIVLIATIGWMIAVSSLNKKFTQKTAQAPDLETVSST